jgi:myo-inositol-1(or 4)-monophosphatase
MKEILGLNQFLDVAKKAAYQAGEFLLDNLDRTREIHYKGEGYSNPYSQADEQAEEIILGIIGDAFPEHGFVAEERGGKEGSSEYRWIIDPLDGTVNFIHRHRYFGVSIALSYRGHVIVGVAYNPVLDEMFSAVKGGGAYLNERSLQVSETTSLGKSLLAMGFPHGRDSEFFSRSVTNFTRLLRNSQAVRRAGSTVLDLCNIACGRYDGFCIVGGELWDYAAGNLVVAEAGGKVTDFKGELFQVGGKRNEVLATNGKIHEKLLKILRE